MFDANNISARGSVQAGYKITVTLSRHHIHTFENKKVIRNNLKNSYKIQNLNRLKSKNIIHPLPEKIFL